MTGVARQGHTTPKVEEKAGVMSTLRALGGKILYWWLFTPHSLKLRVLLRSGAAG